MYIGLGEGVRRAGGADFYGGSSTRGGNNVKTTQKQSAYNASRRTTSQRTHSAERKLWIRLRGNQLNDVNFRRQHAIGNYIADFCSIKEKLIIELDGRQHTEQKAYDEERTFYLQSLGYRVVRFRNDGVMNDMEGVIAEIHRALEDAPTNPPPFSYEL